MKRNLGAAVIEAAKSEVASGAREIGGNNLGPFIEKYLAPAGLQPPQPWCAAFVSWCIRQACAKLGLPAPLPYSASARGLLRAGRRAGLAVASPTPGGLVFWPRGNPAGPFGHVGIVAAISGGRLTTVEGNRLPAVEFFHYNLQKELTKLLGCARL